jgi:hypothetical protein
MSASSKGIRLAAKSRGQIFLSIDGFKHHVRPVLIIRPDNHYPEAMLVALHFDALRIVNMKVDTKGRRIL